MKNRCLILLALLAIPSLRAEAQTKAEMERLIDRLREVVSSIPEVKPGEEYGKAAFLTVTPTTQPVILQGEGRVGAIKFRSPPGRTPRRHFVWAFSPPANLKGWQIAGVKKTAKISFVSFFDQSSERYANLPEPLGDRPFVLQALDASNFEPGEEYIILFTFEDKSAAGIPVALSFIAMSDAVPIYAEAEALEGALGLVRKAKQ